MLQNADLQGANLISTDFSDESGEVTNLIEAKLQKALLINANLKGAMLWEAHLEGADLRSAVLQGANLGKVSFDEETILPDGTHWTPETDTLRFTDPNHPDF
jgi:uncharacterized protein YjbI with pentapeptide repeats